MTWHYAPTRLGQAYDIGADDGANIALIHGPKDGGPADFLANARLIAAAPELLEALKKAAAKLKGIGQMNGFSVCSVAREVCWDIEDELAAVIAKAEG